MTIVKGLTPSSRCLPCYFRLQTEKKNCNFLSFCKIFMIFLPKCSAFYVVLEKVHGIGKKGMTLEKKGKARRHAKTGYGKHYPLPAYPPGNKSC